MQITIEQKILKARQENAKVKLEDVIEDNSMPSPSNDVQEEIKFICNNLGRNTFT
jgi:hypothetical protein